MFCNNDRYYGFWLSGKLYLDQYILLLNWSTDSCTIENYDDLAKKEIYQEYFDEENGYSIVSFTDSSLDGKLYHW